MASKRVTLAFNVAIFSYILLGLLGEILTQDLNAPKTLLDILVPDQPLLLMVIGVLLLAVLTLIGAVLTRGIWNRLLADLFRLRTIDYNEALCLCLVITALHPGG